LESKEGIGISLLVVIATLGIIVFIFFIILFVLFYQKRMLANKAIEKEKERLHQQELLKATIQTAEAERKRIAGDLHDDLGTVLNLAKMSLDKTARSLAGESQVKNLIGESRQLIESSIERMRSISRDLMPPVLVKLGYKEGIGELCRQLSETRVIKAGLSAGDSLPKLAPGTELQLYRIAAEAINNIMKHAGATEINISLNAEEGWYLTRIVHNGKGITDAEVAALSQGNKGIGLKNIQSRALVINASIAYKFYENEYVIEIKAPL